MVGTALAPALWVLWLAQAVAGGGSGVALPATYGLAAEIAPKGRESTFLGRVLMGWTLSLVFGASAAALIAESDAAPREVATIWCAMAPVAPTRRTIT